MKLGLDPESPTDALSEGDWRNLGNFIMDNKGLNVIVSRENPQGEVFEFSLTNENPETRHFSINFTDNPSREEACRRLKSFRLPPMESCDIEWNEPEWDNFTLVHLDGEAIKMVSNLSGVDYSKHVTVNDLEALEPYFPQYYDVLIGKVYLLKDISDAMEVLRLARPLQRALMFARQRKGRSSKARRRQASKVRSQKSKASSAA